MRIGDEDGGQPRGRQFPDRAARTCDGKVGSTVGRPYFVREREQAIVGAGDSVAKRLLVGLAVVV